ncbi:DVUA0089 family protein [Myxococcota bacterium]|nr:DVUA0089 family protein [Myxococcota bacterium]
MHWTRTRHFLTSALAAALAVGGLACGGDSNNNNNNNNGTNPRVTAFNASKTSVASGETVTLSWTVANATSVSITAAPGGAVVEGSTMLMGTATSAAITANTVFTLTAKDAANKTATAMVTVTVAGTSTLEITSFTASPNPTTLNGSTTLSWATKGATSVKITQGVTTLFETTTALDTGTYTVASVTQPSQVYTLSATNGTETLTRDVTVTTESQMTTGETEPNDTQAEANAVTGSVTGEIGSATDVDFFSITVPADGNVLAETSDGMGGCNFDSIITLLDATGTELGSDDESGNPGGCSKIDPAVLPFASGLAAGTYFLKVEGYMGAMGAYTLDVIVGTKECGNGIPEVGEECDDGNTSNGDNCSSACMLEIAGTINPPSGEFTVMVDAQSTKIFTVNIATAGQSITAVASDENGTCSGVDTALGLFAADQTQLGLQFDGAMGEACAAFVGSRDAFATDLDAASYFLLVANEGMTAANVKVSVTIVNPGCGNSIIEARTSEQCDDGNTTAGDGCSATCRFEPVATLMGPPANQTFNNAIDPATQRDVYQVDLSADAYVTAETFMPMAGACTSTTTDTVIELLDSTFTQIAANDDANSTLCSKIQPAGADDLLPAGTYYVVVGAYPGSAIIPNYAVQIRADAPGCGNAIVEATEGCDDGNTAGGDGCSATCQYDGPLTNESEPNNDTATADASGAVRGTRMVVSASIDPAGDLDVFAFTVSGGAAAVKLETHTLAGATSVCDGIDTVIRLLDTMGTELATSDDEGAGLCSLLDGIAGDPALSALADGTYYVEVREYDMNTAMAPYFVSITMQ